MSARKALREVLLDAWSSLSYKAPLKDDVRNASLGYWAESWLGPRDVRRLNAYMVLAAYESNVAREFLVDADVDEASENREYGDAALIVDQILAALLGETQEIVVPGAEDYDPDLEQTPEVAEGEEPPEPPTPEAIAANNEARQLAELQEFLRSWADAVHLDLRMTDCERNAIQMGDGVYLLGWNAKRNRVVPAVMDPGSYFPVLPDEIDTYEYPERVHFAWELDGETFPDRKRRLRRITYAVEKIRPVLRLSDDGRDVVIEVPEGARLKTGSESEYERTYPYADEPSDFECYMTDATWILDNVNDTRDVDALSYEHATFETDEEGEPIRDYPLGFDFVPVIHVPNTAPAGNHFGQSSLARVLQIIDDLQSADTDAQKASATTGSPIVIVHGAEAPAAGPNRRASDTERSRAAREDGQLDLQAGSAWFLGESGSATVVDTAAQLQELRNFVGSLRDRLAVNSRLPAAVLGTMKPSEAPSGYAIQLSFGPLSAMIRQMRLTRNVKYPLMLKMVQRIAMVNEELGAGLARRAEIQLGSYLPSDMAGTLELVKSAWEANLISLETGIQMLIEAGFPVEDIAEEIERIQSRDFEGANELADALGDAVEVATYLGREPVDPEVVPPVVPPPVPTPPIRS